MTNQTKAFSTQGSQLYFPDTTTSPVVVDPIAQMTGFTGLGGKKTKIDITNYDSVNYKEYQGGLLDAGELSFDLIWDFTNANHLLIQQLAQAANASRYFSSVRLMALLLRRSREHSLHRRSFSCRQCQLRRSTTRAPASCFMVTSPCSKSMLRSTTSSRSKRRSSNRVASPLL